MYYAKNYLTPATEAQICNQRHDHTSSTHELVNYGDGINEKTRTYLMRDSIQKVYNLNGT